MKNTLKIPIYLSLFWKSNRMDYLDYLPWLYLDLGQFKYFSKIKYLDNV